MWGFGVPNGVIESQLRRPIRLAGPVRDRFLGVTWLARSQAFLGTGSGLLGERLEWHLVKTSKDVFFWESDSGCDRGSRCLGVGRS